MNNIQIILNDTDWESFKPEIVAYNIFNDQYSLFALSNITFNNRLIDQLINKSIKYYKLYENENEKIIKNKNKNHLYDKMCFILNLNTFDTNLPSLSVVIYIHNKHNYISIYYNANELTNDNLHQFINLLYKNGIKQIKDKYEDNNYINLVVQEYNTLTIDKFPIKKPIIDLDLAYGENFKNVDKLIYNGVCNSDKGIWIFHGIPGSGKSNYLKNLICRLNATTKVKNVIYMPSEMIGQLESPSFIPFIQEHPDSILIIEDADIALQSRKTHGSIVKTILQLTDGILADCLRLKIIATFNCDLSQIDTALLRKGRLQYRHEFKSITRENAIKLATKLKLDTTLFDKDMYKNKNEWALSDIYNIEQDFIWENDSIKIGFKK